MREQLTKLRRAATDRILSSGLHASRVVPDVMLGPMTAAAGRAAGSSRLLRRRLESAMHAALGSERVPETSPQQYIARLATCARLQAAVYNRGFARSGVDRSIRLGDSREFLDEAVSHGKGVLLVSPHLLGHELGAGVINQKYPVTALVRESDRPLRRQLKNRWYDSLGVDTVLRPRHASVLADLRACLKALRRKQLVGVTPDLPVEPGEGTPVEIFGRTVWLKPGFVVLAMQSGAPVLPVFSRWRDNQHMDVEFSRPFCLPRPRRSSDPVAAAHAQQRTLQEWCCWFEAFLRENPADWTFWLDKRWNRILSQKPDEARQAA